MELESVSESRRPTVIKGVRAWPLDHGQERRYPQKQEEVCKLHRQQPKEYLQKLSVVPNPDTVAFWLGAAVVAGDKRDLFSLAFAVHNHVSSLWCKLDHADAAPSRAGDRSRLHLTATGAGATRNGSAGSMWFDWLETELTASPKIRDAGGTVFVCNTKWK
ncbi:hypothetical protein LY76DRAFT_610484 [Colletotrichum caudatum]|nr:hypothetical protein LY76DRAFT_610484 [Colletotrichum caudatum]